ncbi:MAG: low specificity L-threonine aldolase [Rhizobiaceae bacterium]
MFFASDNWAGAHASVAQALADASAGYDPAYGNGAFDKRVAERFNEIFEREVAVFFVATGTAANSLALASVAKPGGVSFCHREAHIFEDECGAPEYLSGGARLRAVDGKLGKMDVERLAAEIGRFPPEFVHAGQPAAISITQATEIGTLYSLQEIDAIAAIARKHGMALHMDGARFANALVALDVSPAEVTWKRGVDMLSFGGTKNGCWCAEAVVLFNPSKASEFAFYRKRAAQLFSKSRFIAAQFEVYLKDDLWLTTARHANAMAARLAEIFSESSVTRLAWQPQANEVFAIMPRETMAQLTDAGAVFYDWHVPASFEGQIGPDEVLCRFVTSFATADEDVAGIARLVTNR